MRFSQTVLYAAEVAGPDGEVVHAMGYQNRVGGGLRARATAWLSGRWPAGNAMILPFPAAPRSMTAANVVDTAGCTDILQDVAAAVASPDTDDDDGLLDDSPRSRTAPPRVQVFATGIYTVVLADDPGDIPAALGRVPADKRPALNPGLFSALARWYPGWTVALCCFRRRDAGLADPLLWWYRPMHPDRLFLPALDGHTGDVPDLAAEVDVDHTVAVGSYRQAFGFPVSYRDPVPAAVAPYLRPTVIGQPFGGRMPNGDFVCRLDDVAAGRFAPDRVKPPAA